MEYTSYLALEINANLGLNKLAVASYHILTRSTETLTSRVESA